MSEIVKPKHYADRPVEVIDEIWSNLGVAGFIPYCLGNTMKYIGRAGLKGEAKQDLGKAIVYLLWGWASVAGHLDEIAPSQWLSRARETAKGFPWEEVFR